MNHTCLYARCLVIVVIALLVVGTGGCMKKIPYDDSQLAAFQKRVGNVQLQFVTDKGKQVAFYIPPTAETSRPPRQIAILYPGIHSLALDFLEYIQVEDDLETGYLLIDYPGRGFCEGMMRPEENYRNSEGALKALAAHLGTDRIGADLVLMGHSFGTGAALQFALKRRVRRVVLAAPFNTLTEAVSLKSHLLAFFMLSEIDNVAQARALLAGEWPPSISIVHGTNDTSLPIYMGREIAAVDQEHILFYEIQGGDHMSILRNNRDLLFQLLLGKAQPTGQER